MHQHIVCLRIPSRKMPLAQADYLLTQAQALLLGWITDVQCIKSRSLKTALVQSYSDEPPPLSRIQALHTANTCHQASVNNTQPPNPAVHSHKLNRNHGRDRARVRRCSAGNRWDYPAELPRTSKANNSQVSLNACFQGNTRAPLRQDE
jgi:hypothetical protein